MRYLELDMGMCSPVTGLICLLGAQGAQGLAGSRRAFPRAATACSPGLWLRNYSHAGMSASFRLAGCTELLLEFPPEHW